MNITVRREPPVRANGSTPFPGAISYFAIAGSNPYTSLIERSLDGSILLMSILYKSNDMRSIMASARVLSPPQICWYHLPSRNWKQKIVDDFLRLLCISSKRFLASASASLRSSYSSIISTTGLVYFFRTTEKVPLSLAACKSSNKSGSRHTILCSSACRPLCQRRRPCRFYHFRRLR